MERFEFAVIAQDQTDFWSLPENSTLRDCRIFCLSLFCVGERTHVCSLTPSTYVDDLKNLFLNPDGSPLTDAQMIELAREGYQYEGLDHSYIGYVNPDRIAENPKVGDVYWTELDPADYEDSDEGREAMRRDAWDEAREEISANIAAYEPPLTGIIPEPV
jgi:hypothetical protein